MDWSRLLSDYPKTKDSAGLSAAAWKTVLVLVVGGLSVFLLAVLLANAHAGRSHEFARAGYCSVAGDTAIDGSPLGLGTFLDLLVGEPAKDGHYTGAVAANFVKGVGLTCTSPPAGYVRRGFAGMYPYYVPGG